MKLYEAPSPNAKRVHVFMAEKGIDFERKQVDLISAENLDPEFLAKNPSGRVPVLELDDGTYLSESVAICRYLEGLHPAPALFGRGPLESAQVEMWQRRAELNVFLNVAMAFRNLSGVFKDRETCVPEWGEVSAGHAVAALPAFETQLASHRFLTGEAFTIADITLAVAIRFAGQVEVELPMTSSLTRWIAEVKARPSFSAK